MYLGANAPNRDPPAETHDAPWGNRPKVVVEAVP